RKRCFMTLLALLGFAAAGALAAIDPLAAGAVFASALALAMFCARPRWLRFVAIALVLVPTLGLVRSRGPNGSATAAGALAESIESGSMLNRAAATLMFAIGLWCLGMRRRGLGEISLAPWFGLFLALVLASILWSDSPPLSLRRAVEALFIIVFA